MKDSIWFALTSLIGVAGISWFIWEYPQPESIAYVVFLAVCGFAIGFPAGFWGCHAIGAELPDRKAYELRIDLLKESLETLSNQLTQRDLDEFEMREHEHALRNSDGKMI
jgi:hypothetical protein